MYKGKLLKGLTNRRGIFENFCYFAVCFLDETFMRTHVNFVINCIYTIFIDVFMPDTLDISLIRIMKNIYYL